MPEDPDVLVSKITHSLADLRRKNGMTQEDLAELLDTAVDNVKRIERGQNITLKTLGRVAMALGVQVELRFIPDPGGSARPPQGKKKKVPEPPR